MSAELSCDVAVIGAGPAGSAAAAALARSSASVLVLEKAHFPRAKVCGALISAEALPALERMGADRDVLEEAETIHRFSVTAPDGRGVSSRLPRGALSLSRERLDTLLAAAAQRAGADVRFGEAVVSLEGNLPDGFLIRTPALTLNARAVLGGWGRYSPLDGKLRRPFFGTPAPLFGFQRLLEGPSAHLEGRAALYLFEGGYLGLSRVEGGLVNLAALAIPEVAKDAHGDFDALLGRIRAASPALERELAGLSPRPGPVLLSEPVHLGSRAPVAGDVLVVGDAAGVLDPFTGTGISAALLTGEAAATALVDFLRGRLERAELLQAHARRYREVVGRRFFWSRALRPFLAEGAFSRFLVPAAAPAARLAARLTRVLGKSPVRIVSIC